MAIVMAYICCDFQILNDVLVHDTDEGETIFLLDNEGIIHISKKFSIMSVT